MALLPHSSTSARRRQRASLNGHESELSQNRAQLPSEFRDTQTRHPSRSGRMVLLMVTVMSLFLLLTASTKSSAPHKRVLAESEYDAYHALELFTLSDYTVLGPTRFPKPSALVGPSAKSGLTPRYGQHRQGVDAVFAFAAEYDLNIYQCFIETLRETGFDGDVVLAVATQDLEKPSVSNYLLKLQSEQGLNVVLYEVELSCFNAELEPVNSAKGGIRLCQIHNMYSNKEGQLVKDQRPARTLQTTRYELYWMWSLRYNPHSWIMLVDARDTYFQTNPFAHVPRETHNRTNGVLHFFGENAEATRIGQSPKNRKWITNAYGNTVIAAMKNKPTICSGSTMGEQIALETYLRAMVAESDETLVKLMGADQGFHNYLYYSNKLANADTIRSITVFGQGLGTMNNLGAMRTKPLEEWGNGKVFRKVSDRKMTVHNWDGSLSPVVHQFDRHKELSNFVYKHKARQFQNAWRTKQ